LDYIAETKPAYGMSTNIARIKSGQIFESNLPGSPQKKPCHQGNAGDSPNNFKFERLLLIGKFCVSFPDIGNCFNQKQLMH
jgi:hypothetical protein